MTGYSVSKGLNFTPAIEITYHLLDIFFKKGSLVLH